MLDVGTQLDPYTILAPLGAGGMGEVYVAEDTRLGRKIALKLLPAQFATDADRVRRFVQEAKAASALNHPNILTIYDIGTHDGAPFIVSELLEGETLRERLNEGAPPVRKAIDYALQIAHGLAAAHGKGIVHRDLKPENLFINHDGRVKILDFGLAKLKASNPADAIGSETPTLTQTKAGVVMGTAGYMSPEQVRGQEADRRSDIFGVGVILYEMLAGKRAFTGQSAVETMSAILKEEPPDLVETHGKIAPGLARVVSHCLEKSPEQRFQSATDLAFALEALSGGPGASVVSTTLSPQDAPAEVSPPIIARRQRRERWAWAAAGLFLVGLLALLPFAIAYLRQTPAGVRVIKLSLPAPQSASFGQIAVSPDGRLLAFTAATGGKDQLWVRALDALTPQALAGTEGATFPFWSPDSRFIGFFALGKLKKIAISSGPVQTLCDAGTGLGGTWNSDGVIVFATLGFGLFRATGGDVTLMTPGELHNAPSLFPDGRHFLYSIQRGRKETRGVYLGSLDGAVKQRLLGADSNALYAPPGYLLFLREGALLAQPFDARQLKLTGEPVPVAERVGRDPNFSRGNFSVSDNGVLVYDPIVNRQSKQLVWVDRQGKQIGSQGEVGGFAKPWLSPDEKRVVVDRLDNQTDNYDLWLYDEAGGGASRFTFDPANAVFPVWSADGSRIVWGSNREGTYDLYQKAASGAGQDELLLKSGNLKVPTDWSLDGRFIIYYQIDPKTKRDVWVLPLSGDQKPFPFLQTESNEAWAQLSPDGRWMAYISDESGRYEVYVQSFPAAAGKKQISTSGGIGPHWRRDGKELFYYAPDGKLMAVEAKSGLPGVRKGASFETGLPRALFEFRSGNGVVTTAPYTVTADGQRFLLNTLVDESGSAPLTVVLNWTAGLKR